MDQSIIDITEIPSSSERRSRRVHQARALTHFRRLDEHIRNVMAEADAVRIWVNELISDVNSSSSGSNEITPQNSSASDDSSDDVMPPLQRV